MNKPISLRLLGAIPYVFCSVGILSSSTLHAESVPLTLEEKIVVKEVIKEVPANCPPNSASGSEPCVAQGPLEYVGGNTRISLGLGVASDEDINTRADLSHVFIETDDSATSGQVWASVNAKAKDDSLDPTLTGAGAKLNHHWVSKDAGGQAKHVNKAFVAVDQNGKRRRKASAGYGQENKDLFWEAYGSKGFTEKFWVNTDEYGNELFEQSYDYGVGARVGKMFDKQLVRVRAGVDYEWASEHADYEDKPTQVTASIGAEKFFQDSPHSVSMNASYYKKAGGAESLKQTGTRGDVNYRYDIGKNIFRSDQKFRRVRVEIPGTPRPPQYKKDLVKNTMELEADNFFKLDRAELTEKAIGRLETVVGRIRQSGHEGNIRITGNTCDLGSLEHNQDLSERRAKAVRQFFISRGFKPDELLSRGLGETHPKYDNNLHRHKNRRVDIEYITEQKKFKKVLIDPGSPGEPKITWRQERCPTPPVWVQRALHNQIQYKSTVDDYRTLEKNQGNDDKGDDFDDNGDDQSGNNGQDGQDGKDGKDGEDGKDGKDGIDAVATPHAPNAVSDFFTTWVNEPGGFMIYTDQLLQNDTDVDGDTLQFTGVIALPSNGSLTDKGDGRLLYTPRHNFCGKDAFTYSITDGNGGTSTATVYIDVQKIPGSD